MGTREQSLHDANGVVIARGFPLISTGRVSEVGSLASDDLYFELPYGPGREVVRSSFRLLRRTSRCARRGVEWSWMAAWGSPRKAPSR
jgi:hypothetical protein